LAGLALLLLSNVLFAATPYITPYMKNYTVKGEFEDVRLDIEMAITDRGIVINNVSHIGNMLARTAEAVGATKTVYRKAEALEFCSSTISRAMMEADPHNIVFCPYIIAIYTLANEKEEVHIAFRRPIPVGDKRSRESLRVVEKLLDDIVAEVAN